LQKQELELDLENHINVWGGPAHSWSPSDNPFPHADMQPFLQSFILS